MVEDICTTVLSSTAVGRGSRSQVRHGNSRERFILPQHCVNSDSDLSATLLTVSSCLGLNDHRLPDIDSCQPLNSDIDRNAIPSLIYLLEVSDGSRVSSSENDILPKFEFVHVLTPDRRVKAFSQAPRGSILTAMRCRPGPCLIGSRCTLPRHAPAVAELSIRLPERG